MARFNDVDLLRLERDHAYRLRIINRWERELAHADRYPSKAECEPVLKVDDRDKDQ